MFPQRKLSEELAQSAAAAALAASASSSVPQPAIGPLLRPQAKRKLDHPTESFGDAEEISVQKVGAQKIKHNLRH